MSDDAVSRLEMSLVGAVLLKPDTLALLPTLETDDFQSFQGKAAWSAIRNLEARRAPIDLTTTADEAERMGTTDMSSWLGVSIMDVPTVSNAIEYANRLRDNAIRVRLASSLSELLDESKARRITGAEMLGEVLAIASRMDAEQPEDALSIGEIVKRRVREIEQLDEARRSGASTLTGFHTGIEKLDEKLGGWQPGIVSIVAARPGMGKSSLGLATADACSKSGVGVHLFSLEDTASAYADRALSRISQVSAEQLRNCSINRGEMQDVSVALRDLSRRSGWLFDGRSGITADEIVRSVRRRKKDNKTRVVIVDYIQLLRKPHPRMSTHEALSEGITALADAAKADGMAYVVMSQLNREIEKRDDKRPQMADLRESGSLEERSKCVIGVYRGAAYKLPPKQGVDYECTCRKSDLCSHAPSDEEFQAQVQLMVLKNSNGRTGRITAKWHGPTTRME
jgi:replicative DNA helicase